MQTPEVLFKKLDDNALIPAYQTERAAGLDLSVCLPRGDHDSGEVVIEPIHKGGKITKLPCGFACAIPEGFEGQVRPRSGLATKFGVTIPNAPGTVDSDYRGEMFVALINLGNEPHTIRHGDRVAQMVISPVAHVTSTEVDDLDTTARGAGGFGSTGITQSV
jgi:dUTP pyrophosphatase